jgi:hypothetical protein
MLRNGKKIDGRMRISANVLRIVNDNFILGVRREKILEYIGLSFI